MAFPVVRSTTRCATILSTRLYAPKLQSVSFYICKNISVKSSSLANRVVSVQCGTSSIHLSNLLGHSKDGIFSVLSMNRYTHVGTSVQKTESAIGNDQDDEYKNVYRFKFIVHAKVLSRLKIYQTGITLLVMPMLTYYYTMGSVPITTLLAASAIATLATVMLYLMSYYSRHMVGILKVDTRGENVQISHLSFWGKRVDTVIKLSDVIPLTDTSQSLNDAYVLLKTYDGKYKFYMFHRAGHVYDRESLLHILGQVSSVGEWTNTDIEMINKVKRNRN